MINLQGWLTFGIDLQRDDCPSLAMLVLGQDAVSAGVLEPALGNLEAVDGTGADLLESRAVGVNARLQTGIRFY